MLWLALCVGINNFSTGRLPTGELVAKVTEPLHALDGTVAAAYGATGNLVVTLPDDVLVPELQRALRNASGRDWAVLRWSTLQNVLGILESLPTPPAEARMRWTPGVALAVEPVLTTFKLQPSAAAHFTTIGRGVVGVAKYDIEDDLGRLDAKRRLGGWGRVSEDVARQAGGIWTSRSQRTLVGLQRRVGRAVVRT